MRRLLRYGLALGLIGFALFWGLTRAETVPPAQMAGLTGDAARGEQVFLAGGCASCHAAPGTSGEARLILSGGARFISPFGTFLAPNISPDPRYGIGTWSPLDLANAMRLGTAPDGSHYYPAFPYVAYANASLQDIADLHAYLATLPASDQPSRPHEVGFPFSIRRGLGLWKRLYAGKGWVMDPDMGPGPGDGMGDGPGDGPGDGMDPELIRGRYLVEALGHCAECHTARGPLGGLDRSAWMGGAPGPDARSRIPNLTPAALNWSARDIAFYLETGFTPEFDSAGGKMADVVLGTAKLPPADRAAMAAYLKALAPAR